MPDTSTVFQAEIEAISHACQYALANLKELNIKYIKILSDSQAAIKALNKPGLVRRVLLKFKAKKSPGPDKLKPIIFKYLPQNVQWKESNVVFIPKQGKTSYQEAKSFRPISLSNYLLKGLEKLLVEQMDLALEDHPIHKNQHGFQRGLSTETAISKTVNYIVYRSWILVSKIDS